MSYSIAWQRHGVTCVYAGVIAFDEIISAMTSIHRHVDFDQLKYAIHDFRGVTALEPAFVDMSILVAHTIGASYSNPHISTAMVAVLPNLAEICKQYAARSHQKIRVFDNLQDGKAWLRASESLALLTSPAGLL